MVVRLRENNLLERRAEERRGEGRGEGTEGHLLSIYHDGRVALASHPGQFLAGRSLAPQYRTVLGHSSLATIDINSAIVRGDPWSCSQKVSHEVGHPDLVGGQAPGKCFPSRASQY